MLTTDTMALHVFVQPLPTGKEPSPTFLGINDVPAFGSGSDRTVVPRLFGSVRPSGFHARRMFGEQVRQVHGHPDDAPQTIDLHVSRSLAVRFGTALPRVAGSTTC